MITNERQYKITKSQLGKLKQAIETFDLDYVTKRIGSDILAKAELSALKSEMENLSIQIMDYEYLKSGNSFVYKALTLAELPKILIMARIAQNLSQKELANLIGVKEQQIQRYEAEEFASASLKRLLQIADALNISVAEIADISIATTTELFPKTEAIDWKKFPIKEMYRRGWFEDVTESLDSVIQDAESLVSGFIQPYIKKPYVSLHRLHIRSNSQVDQYSVLAWECRVLSIAERETEDVKFRKEFLDSKWFTKLRSISVQQNGPIHAKEFLNEAGIKLVIEPQLEKTYIDGAAFLHNELPVIGMTLRYDRVDNFWFVLFHELMHVIYHLQKGKLESVFDDLDHATEEKIEIEADYLASQALINEVEWNKSIVRYTRSSESVIGLAAKLGISPAIIAGRIRFEAKNYRILNDLIGQGEVRKQFPNVLFGV